MKRPRAGAILDWRGTEESHAAVHWQLRRGIRPWQGNLSERSALRSKQSSIVTGVPLQMWLSNSATVKGLSEARRG